MSANFEYGFTIGAIWTGESAINQSIMAAERMSVTWTNASKDIGLSWQTQQSQLQKSMNFSGMNNAVTGFGDNWGRTMRGMIWSTQLAIMYGGFLYQNMLKEELQTNTLANAQDTYNRAVKEYGVNSDQAIRAARNLENAQMLVTRANTMATLMTASFGFQLVATGIQIVQQFPALTTYAAKLWAIATAQAAAHPWLVPAMIAGVAAVGVAGAYAYGQSQNNINVNIDNRGNTDLHNAFAEAERKATYELRRAT